MFLFLLYPLSTVDLSWAHGLMTLLPASSQNVYITLVLSFLLLYIRKPLVSWAILHLIFLSLALMMVTLLSINWHKWVVILFSLCFPLCYLNLLNWLTPILLLILVTGFIS